MPPLADQFSAVLATPIPFAVVLVFFGIVFWRVFEWRYRAVINKMKELGELSRVEVDHWKDAAARTNSRMDEQLELLRKQRLPAEAKPVIDELTQTSSQVKVELDELGKANTASTAAYGLWQPPEWLKRSVIEPNISVTQPSASNRPPDKPQR